MPSLLSRAPALQRQRDRIVVTQLSMVSHPPNNVEPMSWLAPLRGGAESHEAESRLNNPRRVIRFYKNPLKERRLSRRFN